LFSGDCGGGFGRTWDACDLLSQCRDATESEKARARNAIDFHSGKLPLGYLGPLAKKSSTFRGRRMVALSDCALTQVNHGLGMSALGHQRT
jgi:hypothetical protein